MDYSTIVKAIQQIHDSAQITAGRSINQVLTMRNWLIGACIVEFEQNGEDRAAYGERLLKTIADEFNRAGYQGLSASNLKNFRQFALVYPLGAIRQTLSGEFDTLTPSRFPNSFHIATRTPAWFAEASTVKPLAESRRLPIPRFWSKSFHLIQKSGTLKSNARLIKTSPACVNTSSSSRNLQP